MPIAADSALAMATSSVWSGASTAVAGCSCPPTTLQAQYSGPRAPGLVMPPAGATGCPLPKAVGEAGVGRAQPDSLPVLRHPLHLEVKTSRSTVL